MYIESGFMRKALIRVMTSYKTNDTVGLELLYETVRKEDWRAGDGAADKVSRTWAKGFRIRDSKILSPGVFSFFLASTVAKKKWL